jgi:hypothetical protein
MFLLTAWYLLLFLPLDLTPHTQTVFQYFIRSIRPFRKQNSHIGISNRNTMTFSRATNWTFVTKFLDFEA